MKLSFIGDCLAIPLWIWLLSYFLRQEKKDAETWALAALSAGGLVADAAFVIWGL